MSSMTFVLLAALALVIGSLITVQAATNAVLSNALGSFSFVSLAVFAVAFWFVLVWIALTSSEVPVLSAFRAAPVYGYLGGVIVGSYALAITLPAPRLGVGNAIFFIVTGQILAAVVIDHFGLFDSLVPALSWQRVFGSAADDPGLILGEAHKTLASPNNALQRVMDDLHTIRHKKPKQTNMRGMTSPERSARRRAGALRIG
jgi:bacterial/archaeal transporter family-2 protein